MRRAIVTAVLLLAAASACAGTEVGFRLNLRLETLGLGTDASWWITVGAYANLVLDPEWHARVVAGTGIAAFTPFADIEVARVYTPELALLGNLLLQSFPQMGMKATAQVGGRYQTGDLPDPHIELRTLPVGWRLSSFNRQLRGELFFSGNISGDVTLGQPGAGLFGGRLTLSVLSNPPRTGVGFIPIGGSLFIAPELAVHVGVDI
jgi:hypothetical protein